MPKSQNKSFRNVTDGRDLHELVNMVKEFDVQLGKARFELANNTLKDTSIIKKIKSDLARTLTAIKKRRAINSPEGKR